MNIEGALSGFVALGATWVLWVLVALSVVAVAIMLERAIFFVRTRTDTDALRARLSEAFDRDARGRLGEPVSMEGCIVAAGLGKSCPKEAEESMAAEMQLQRLRFERHLAFLGTLGNNAPFVGLLGTVLGIIGAFHQLDAARGKLTTGLMAEIGEALVATAIGLLVALPAVAAYNAFQRTIQVRINRGDALGRELVARMHAAEHAEVVRERGA